MTPDTQQAADRHHCGERCNWMNTGEVPTPRCKKHAGWGPNGGYCQEHARLYEQQAAPPSQDASARQADVAREIAMELGWLELYDEHEGVRDLMRAAEERGRLREYQRLLAIADQCGPQHDPPWHDAAAAIRRSAPQPVAPNNLTKE